MDITKKHIYLCIAMAMLFMPLTILAKTTDVGIRVKELCRIMSVRENPLVGYGIVTGLAGTGDSRRSKATLQSISNVLKNFGIIVSPNDINSRNVAAVMVSSTLNPFAQTGDKVDVYINAVGDARSLLGGTLLISELKAPDNNVYALAQGPISVGGFHYDLNGNLVQKNHPNAGKISGGAVIERTIDTQLIDDTGQISFVLNEPDFTTASRITTRINQVFKQPLAEAKNSARINIRVPEQYINNQVGFITKIESIYVEPDYNARIVINEKTGTIVAGGSVKIAKISITHGDLNIDIRTEYSVSQPILVSKVGDAVSTEVTPNTQIRVIEETPKIVTTTKHTTVSDLVQALSKVKASSRDIITILQAVKRAGGMHAQIIVE